MSSSGSRLFHHVGRLILTCSFFFLCVAADAGGGPEGLLLVVNPQSEASMTIANHYAQLRDIPADNIIYIPWNRKLQTSEINTFRQKLLLPLLHTINARHLANQIDGIIYSSDFPTAISLDADIHKIQTAQLQANSQGDKAKPVPEWPKQLAPVGSINGLTYLWQSVIAGHPISPTLRDNFYLRLPVPEQRDAPTLGFRGNREFNDKGVVVPSGGTRYFLSAMLAVTSGRGNTVPEVLNYLKRSVSADGTIPKGTIYFVKNGDIRSKVRQEMFPLAVEQLKQLGVEGKIIDGTIPLNRDDVQGAVVGTPEFNWQASGSTILPGAICEHFTSFGGIMTIPASQTPLSEFLRYGAAGASGTVVEPFAITNKFPLPLIQVYYARGCTLAEAFYQSIAAPYQLLIVGDPLCRPWARIPKVTVTGAEPNATVHGKLTLTPDATTPEQGSISCFRLFVDGTCVSECKPGETFALETTEQADGYHDVRIVAVGPAPIESQGRVLLPLRFDNHGRTIEASVATEGTLYCDKPVAISAKAPGSHALVVIQGSRVVAQASGEEGRLEIPADTLGSGPVRLRVAGLGSNGMASHVIAAPLDLTVEERTHP